jgi:predicted O-linked N-acetylglucosamine transferase (SPINDLY family)
MTTHTDSPPDPAALPARLQAALALHQQGQLAPARAQYEAILRDFPQQADALHLLGVVALQGGDAATAVTRIGAAIAANPRNPEFHLNQAIALHAQGRSEDALACHDRALALNPELVNAHLGRAVMLKALGRSADAAASYERALALKPDFAEAHYNLGNIQRELGQREAAAASFERAVTLKPGLVEAHVNRGATLLQLGRHEQAQAAFEQALTLRPDLIDALVGRADACLAQLRLEDAIAGYERALALQPQHAEALCNRGKAHYKLTRYNDARASLEAALALRPALADAHLYLGNTFINLHRNEDALAAFEHALALQPDYADAWYGKGGIMLQFQRTEEAAHCFEQALRFRPDNALLQGELQKVRMQLCDWTGFDTTIAQLGTAIAQGEAALLPFDALPLLDAPALQLQLARTFTAKAYRLPPLPGAFPQRVPGEKIRLGYFSADFCEHPVARLMAGPFEQHNRMDFEVIGFGFGPPARDAMRTRIEKACDRFFDVTAMSDEEIAQLARAVGIDIAIDLGGFTLYNRTGIFARRAAPVQASYIGYLGTMGAAWMDYLIADAVLVPPEQRAHYAENILRLPWYQANDSVPPEAGRAVTRADLGLPAQGMVFACFNNHFKITPAVFDSWMRILAAVPDSVLYLLVHGDTARRNLRAAAEARGIGGGRVLFAGRVSRADYLARYRVADLFLDTWPCNAGATASDALYMNVPVLTCRGHSFAARMAASVLTALDMPELITSNQEEYEQRAIALAHAPAELAALKKKVETQRQHAPLYDTARFTHHLEAGFHAMHARRLAGLAPEDIDIKA